jgi:type VI secretion system protein VasI
MKRAPILVLILVAARTFAQLAPATGTGDLGDRLEEASRIEDPTLRLQAFDNIVTDYELSSQNIVSVSSSKWTDSSSKDPLDDSRTIMLTLDSDSGHDSLGNPVSLILRFRDNRSEVYINWKTGLGDHATVSMRIGTERASTSTWTESANRKATFYPGDPIELIGKLKNVDTFLAKVTPENGEPILAVFDVRGLGDIISRYASDVQW